MIVIPFFKKRWRQIRDDADKFASTKNVSKDSYSFYFIFAWILFTSAIGAMFTIYLLSFVDNTPVNWYNFVAYQMIIPLWFFGILFSLGKYFFYIRILEIHYTSKIISYVINKLDMIWWRKFRKHSPLTEGLFKLQEKTQSKKHKLTKPQRRLFAVVLISALLLMYIGIHYDDFMEFAVSYQETSQQIEINENNNAKIFDGTERKIMIDEP